MYLFKSQCFISIDFLYLSLFLCICYNLMLVLVIHNGRGRLLSVFSFRGYILVTQSNSLVFSQIILRHARKYGDI